MDTKLKNAVKATDKKAQYENHIRLTNDNVIGSYEWKGKLLLSIRI